MKRKTLSLFLVVFILSTVLPIITHAESMVKNNISREELIKQDEVDAKNGKDKLIASFKVNEYDTVMKLKKKSDAELKSQGLSEKEIQEIRDYDVDKIIRDLQSKSDKELKGYGYTKERIDAIRFYDGSEKSIQRVSGRLYCDIYLNRHEYDSSTGRTIFRVRLNWEWNRPPLVFGTDIIGAVVSEGMYLNDGLSYHRVFYYTVDRNGDVVLAEAKTYDFRPTEEIHCIKCTFDLYKNLERFGLEGVAYCTFTKLGRVPEAAMVVQYGHSTYTYDTPSVTISAPPSLGLTFTPLRRVEVLNSDENYYIHSVDYGRHVTIR